MLTIQVESPAGVEVDRQREFADTVIGAAVDLLGVQRGDIRLVLTDWDEARERREAAFWAAAWSGC